MEKELEKLKNFIDKMQALLKSHLGNMSSMTRSERVDVAKKLGWSIERLDGYNQGVAFGYREAIRVAEETTA